MRVSDPPFTARECAEWMGYTPTWIRSAIDKGVRVGPGKALVRLEAETLELNGRRTHRIHFDAFVRFLQAIGWKRLPARGPAPGAIVEDGAHAVQ